MDKEKLVQLKKIDTDKVKRALAACGKSDYYGQIAYAYLLYAYQLKHHPIDETVNDWFASLDIDDIRRMFVNRQLSDSLDFIELLRDTLSTDELSAFLLYGHPGASVGGIETTPTGISRLAIRLMNIQPGMKIADVCTGSGSFLVEAYEAEPSASYFGNDINKDAVEVVRIRAELLGGNIQIAQENVLEQELHLRSFHAVFSNFPLGFRDRSSHTLNLRQPFTKANTLEWGFARTAYNYVFGPGRVVCLLTNGSTWNTLDRNARREMLSGGIVEAVIALPDRVLDYTSVGTVLLVLSHGNESVMMVDARNLCEAGRRQNIIRDEDIETICNSLLEEGQYSCRVPNQEIWENDYVLNPIRYLTKPDEVENGVPFGSVIKKITRGAPATARNLDQLVSRKPTDYNYITLASVRDGIIDEDLPFLKAIDERYQKYCVKENDLILSKNGYPFKVAVVGPLRENQEILANGNMFIIRLDTERVDPYYLQAFFESELGTSILKSISVGSMVPNIGVDMLKRISIPLIDMDKQKEIAVRYRALQDEAKVLRIKTEKNLNQMKHLFDEYKED